MQGLNRLKAEFPQAIGPLFPDAHYSEPLSLSGQSVRDRDLGVHFQRAGCSNRRAQRTHDSGKRGLFEHAAILCGALHLNGNMKRNPRFPAAFSRRGSFGQSDLAAPVSGKTSRALLGRQ